MSEDVKSGGAGRKIALYLSALAALIAIDQISKWFVFERLLRVQGEPAGLFAWLSHRQSMDASMDSVSEFTNIHVLPFFDLVAVWNPGISFGMLQNGGDFMAYALIAFALLMTVVVTVWGIRTHSRVEQIATLLIAAGAFSNAFDRLRFKAVADFLYFHYNELYWPAFNIADSCITIGAVMLVFYILLGKEE